VLTTVLVVVWLIAGFSLVVLWCVRAVRARHRRIRNREELSVLDDLTYYDYPPRG
jgi:hypothetical protein